MFRFACGMGSARWIDFGPFWRQFDVSFEPSWFVIVGAVVGTLGIGFVVFVGVWLVASMIEGWRSRPVPQLDNPVLEGATRDLAGAVELLRRGEDQPRADALLGSARGKIARCRHRLSRDELRALTTAWNLVALATRAGA
ncbi:MAG: hypothetical protein GQE15_23615 [Archangiaceae bacterium]|nr:hypothetical protein [Archangiaceae bacterium]